MFWRFDSEISDMKKLHGGHSGPAIKWIHFLMNEWAPNPKKEDPETDRLRKK